MANTLTIVGLGAGGMEQLTMGSYRLLKNAETLYIRTAHHPVVKELKEEGVQFTSFDQFYEKNDSFEDTYRAIVDQLWQETVGKDVVYAVPGHPLIAEQTVQTLLHEAEEKGVSIDIAGGQSFLDPMFSALKIDPIQGCQILDATRFSRSEVQIRQHLIFVQVYDAFVASEVKLTLMELLPDDYGVTVVRAAGNKDESVIKIPLYELDRSVEVDNLTAVYVPPVSEDALLYGDFEYLREVIAALRGPDGCPWDKKQTHESLKKYLIEEAYEVLDAIDEQDEDHLAEELGDVLLQVMLHAQIGEDEGMFTIADVVSNLNDKLVRRHPHVFGEKQAENAEEVSALWEDIKKEEGYRPEKSRLDKINKALPGVLRAYELQKSAAEIGFDWSEPEPIWDKVTEELEEFMQALAKEDEQEKISEFGDILFALINLGRYYKINPEEAVLRTNSKFYNRFRYIEEQLAARGLKGEELTLDELDSLWDEAKGKGH
ncbi:nucleoside triphosphate pyrophosphohydrolase [Pseudalkalibacillus caeni]|uniref:Nucleoside triphosphate pyrophosphohydrolase n=1 Tax=Exobacillus caeni TaxID=2574798 RepID=A0A5R9F111_9BACL|nr:nucleoside triphosphate pyrophosphohydrolase [Pseudalkalibacillus caeni]TLS35118.1 nucleoside triphosphate pyrophosphohydrolase [Pseudalkalibacillus caeni]